jgi:long-subunit fatty acid transport protein
MKLGRIAFGLGLCVSGTAAAGGLFLPGSGAVSTARAGASVASAEDGEALGLNPAGIAKAKGTVITIGISAINYNMSFQRNGTYDDDPNEPDPFEGQAFPVVENDAEPPLGIGRYQPIPLIAVVSDLGGKVPNLSAGIGLYAPNSYPFRRLNTINGRPYYQEQDGMYIHPATFGDAPPPSRYDLIAQEAAVILPAIAVAYRPIPDLDVGARFAVGRAEVKSTVAIWGVSANFVEQPRADGVFTLEAHDSLVLGWGLGAAYRIGPKIELGAQFTAPTHIRAEGDARSNNGPSVLIDTQVPMIVPSDTVRCAPGGTNQVQKGCVQLALPMTATLGGRYKFTDGEKVKGDIELDLTWEHWGKRCDYVVNPDPDCYSPTDYRVVVDAQIETATTMGAGLSLMDNVLEHGLRDTFGVRLGGSYNIPVGANEITARGGVAYDTAAAKPGWERVDIDGAARTMIALGGSFKLPRVRIDAGFGYVHEGTRSDSRNCNPVINASPPPLYTGCSSSGEQQPLEDREGPSPINPIVNPGAQLESPVNQGTYKSSYIMIMFGASTWF